MTVPDAGLDWLADRISEPTARGIAACLTDLIRSGELARGARLPTVRKLAGRLGVSPATVSEAWSTLRHARVISTQRRNGTVVIGPPNVPHPVRYERLGNFGGRPAVDLTVAAPDPSLLPRLDTALAEGLRAERLNDYSRETITPRLRAAAGADWPFDAQDWLAVGGGYEGIQLTCQAIAVPGDRVAVEHPSAARLLDIAEARGVTLIPVTCDEHGPRPEALAAALRANPVAFIYQPRAHTPCGHAVPAARSAQLAELLRPTSLTIIEDDGLGQLSAMPLHSIGAHLPGRTVLIRSFSKSHGPDLRLAVLGGAAEVVDRVRVLRSFGTGWTSRILQDALAYLLTDEATIAAITVARDCYVRRRGLLADALRARGVPTVNADGLMLWIPVAAESEALVTLAAHGIAASPGSRYCVSAADPHIRVATARLPEDPGAIASLADILALAAHGD